MSMMKNRFAETRKAKKEIKTVEFDGLMPWSPETGLMTCNTENEVTETSNDDTDDGLMPWSPETGLMTWGTPAQREAANKALVNHFTSRR